MSRARRFDDPLAMPDTGETPLERYRRALALAGTDGALYVERRGVPCAIASAAGVRFDPDFAGRPAVLAPLVDRAGELVAVHARYLHANHAQDKMLTVGPRGGAIEVLGGARAEPLIVVEGLFDALSLAVAGFASVATIGRAPAWLAEVARGRTTWLAFDAGKPGERELARQAALLEGSRVERLAPPPACKDWSTALAKRGASVVAAWVRERLAAGGTRPA